MTRKFIARSPKTGLEVEVGVSMKLRVPKEFMEQVEAEVEQYLQVSGIDNLNWAICSMEDPWDDDTYELEMGDWVYLYGKDFVQELMPC